MRKDEEVLRKNDPHILSAMEQQAVEFNNWLTNSEWEKLEGDYDTYWNGKAGEEMKVENTKSLYQLFNQQN